LPNPSLHHYSLLMAHSLPRSLPMPLHHSILLIDDSPGECELFRLALAQTGTDAVLYTEHDAEASLHFLKHQSSFPSFILLDWRLRNQTGDVFLKRLRAEARFVAIPVVMFTTSDDTSDITMAYDCGANGYVLKPGTFDELVHCVRDLCQFWLLRN